jgi:hypothetical protein
LKGRPAQQDVHLSKRRFAASQIRVT